MWKALLLSFHKALLLDGKTFVKRNRKCNTFKSFFFFFVKTEPSEDDLDLNIK